MKQSIKESFDQIHAPQSLINDTKANIHEQAQKEEHVNTPLNPRKSWEKRIKVASAMAAGVCLIVVGAHFLQEKPKVTDPIENNVNVGEGITPGGTQFQAMKSEEQWKAYVAEVKKKKIKEQKIVEPYILYEMPIEEEGKEYRIQFQLKEGRILSENNEYAITGTLCCEVFEGTKSVGVSRLEISNTTEFTKDVVQLEQKDINDDGKVEFLLETSLESSQLVQTWYTLDDECKVVEVAK